MPRTGRVVVPNYPHHVVQRGHNRQLVFDGHDDFAYYLDTLETWKRRYAIKVYGYCLMTNHVHLILEPPDDAEVLGKLMKRLAGRQTRYMNRRRGRTGTLWEGRYKSSPIQTDEYLLACCRYVDLNPVRACMVTVPEAYQWSSYRAKVGLENCEWLDLDPSYLSLADASSERMTRYRHFVESAVPDGEWELIREAVSRGQLTGNRHFIDKVQQLTGRRIEHRRPGGQPAGLRNAE